MLAGNNKIVTWLPSLVAVVLMIGSAAPIHAQDWNLSANKGSDVYLHSARIDTLQFHTPPAVIEQCIADAAHDYGLHPQLVRAVLNVEGGRVGSISRNSNGSYDLGLMQINTTWLPALRRFHVKWQDLTDKPCVNIRVGSWILANQIKGADDYWVGVGNYHSKTPTYNRRYRQRIHLELERLISSTALSRPTDLPVASLITMR